MLVCSFFSSKYLYVLIVILPNGKYEGQYKLLKNSGKYLSKSHIHSALLPTYFQFLTLLSLWSVSFVFDLNDH